MCVLSAIRIWTQKHYRKGEKMPETRKPPRLKKAKFPKGKSVRVNLKLSEEALRAFDDMKNRKACKVNDEVFNYLCDFADESALLTKKYQKEPHAAIFDIRVIFKCIHKKDLC